MSSGFKYINLVTSNSYYIFRNKQKADYHILDITCDKYKCYQFFLISFFMQFFYPFFFNNVTKFPIFVSYLRLLLLFSLLYLF